MSALVFNLVLRDSVEEDGKYSLGKYRTVQYSTL